MWLYAGLILLGVVLGVAGLLLFIRLDLKGGHSPADPKRRPPMTPEPRDLGAAARAFVLAAEQAFGSREEASKPEAWVTPSGKNFIPKAVKSSHSALKAALKAGGKRRTPSGVRLVEAALKIVQGQTRNDSPEPELPKITFAEGEGLPTP